MPGTFFGIEIGQRALSAFQIGEDVVGQNIANANTAGYSRQSAQLQTTDPYGLPDQSGTYQPATLGSGVTVRAITRARDQFIDAQTRAALGSHGQLSTQSGALSQIEAAFGEPSSTGLNETLGRFYQGFSDLANNPEDEGVRAAAVQNGATLAHVFQDTAAQLSAQTVNLSDRVANDVNTVNAYGQQIAALNITIRNSIVSGQQPNDLLDQRDRLLDKLSGIAGASVTNLPDGTVNVAIGTSDLVQGIHSNTLSLSGPSGLSARGDLQSGELAGLTAAQTALADAQTNLNALAGSVAAQVNTVHSAGAGLDGTTGLNFFTVTAGAEASSISVNPALLADPKKLAAAALPAGGGVPPPGDSTTAEALAALQNAGVSTPPLSGQTAQGFYQAFVSNLAGQTSGANASLANASATLTQLSGQRDNVSGVSTDSEMIDMMKYQRGYQAAARVISTANDMIGTIINDLIK